MLLVLSITFYFHYNIWGCICSTGPFKYKWLKGYIYSSCYYRHQIGSIHLSHCFHIFPWLCAWDVYHIIFCHLLYIHSGDFPAQRPVTRSFDVFCGLRLSKQLNKQLWDWRFEMLSRSLWRHCNVHQKHDFRNSQNVVKAASEKSITTTTVIKSTFPIVHCFRW